MSHCQASTNFRPSSRVSLLPSLFPLVSERDGRIERYQEDEKGQDYPFNELFRERFVVRFYGDGSWMDGMISRRADFFKNIIVSEELLKIPASFNSDSSVIIGFEFLISLAIDSLTFSLSFTRWNSASVPTLQCSFHNENAHVDSRT